MNILYLKHDDKLPVSPLSIKGSKTSEGSDQATKHSFANLKFAAGRKCFNRQHINEKPLLPLPPPPLPPSSFIPPSIVKGSTWDGVQGSHWQVQARGTISLFHQLVFYLQKGKLFFCTRMGKKEKNSLGTWLRIYHYHGSQNPSDLNLTNQVKCNLCNLIGQTTEISCQVTCNPWNRNAVP